MKKIITFGLLLFLGSPQLKAESPSRTVWASQTSLLDNNLYSFAHGNASLAAVSKSGIGNTIKSCSILSNFTIDGINYVVTSTTTVEIGSNPNASGEIVIPASVTINGSIYSVTRVGYQAFQNCTGLTSITIPNSVNFINSYAFYGCSSLTTFTIPNAVTRINTATFYGCSSLTSVTIPNSVTSIDTLAFIFTGLTSVTIPNSVTWIGNAAFAVCSSLTMVIIPNSVTGIGEAAFNSCFGLTTVTIGNSLSSIGAEAFGECTSLISVTCNVTSPITISTNVFANVNQAACSLTVPSGSVAAYEAAAVWQGFNPIIGASTTVFNTTTVTACTSYTWANNNETYTETGIYTGTTTNGVTEQLDLTITTPPTSFTSAGINYTVTSPTTVEVGNNSGASGSIVIPATVTTACGTYSVTSIGDNAFLACSGLISITIPNSVTSIGEAAFGSCSGLTSITIPNSVTSIGSIAFSESGLATVIISNSVTSINYGTFAQCSNLTSVTIPNSVTSIDFAAFAFCTGLTSVTIPNSVMSIGDVAFYGCTGLTSFICNVTTPITISANVFQNVNQAACNLIVPGGSVAAYQAAAVWQNFYFNNNNLSKIIDSQCGTTLSSLSTTISANVVSGASGYRFKVINGATTEIIEAASGSRWFRLTSLPGGTFYNTAYTISVAVKKNNVWGDYGDACTVTTAVFPATEVQTSQCGTTLASIVTTISANPVANATGYKFKVVYGVTTETIETNSGRWFRLTSLPSGALYNTTYTISVATRYNGVWSEYGEECTVTTPVAPATKVRDSQCGITLASINTTIVANAVSNTTGYRFKVVNGAATETIDAVSGSRWFRLTSLSGGPSYNTTYTVSVATRYNGVWSEYGEACLITTPTAPLTKLQDRQCGITLNSGNADLLYANPVSVAQKYRFEVSLGADVYTYDTASSSVRSFRMTEVSGLTLERGTTYAVRVSIMVNGVWQPYGAACTVTTYTIPSNVVRTINLDTTNFNVVTYPNPFTDNFNLNLTSISEEKVTVMVYDMTGKLLERKEVVPRELSELQIGNNFASGVYNVIVSQSTNTKSLQVIKK